VKHLSRRPQLIATIAAVILVPLICGLVFLANNAGRDWSLHWIAAGPFVTGAGPQPYAAVGTPRGWDALWQTPAGTLTFARFDSAGHRLSPDIRLRGTPVTSTLGRAGTTDVAAWREDYNGGSRLVAAVLRPGHQPSYHVLATGKWPLEHPQAFTDGATVGILFSWQRPAFNVYLTRVDPATATAPVALTHVKNYAFNPHGVLDAQNHLRLIYLDLCCDLQSFHVVAATYTAAGRPIGSPQRLDTLTEMVRASNGTVPNRWGTDIQGFGNQIWAAWGNDSGIQIAAWSGSHLLFNHPAALGAGPNTLALAVSRDQRELIWQQQATPNPILTTVRLSSDGLPIDQPDRVVYEAAGDDNAITITRPNAPPAITWQAINGTNGSTLEASRFTPTAIGPPNVWARFGLGVANPIGDFLVLLAGGVAMAILITVGNILLLLALLAAYLLLIRMIDARWRWYAYTLGLAVMLYLAIIVLGAPSPPIFGFSAFSTTLGLLAMAGMIVFVLLISRTWLRRLDDTYRAAGMAFLALYFVSFLQALTIVQGLVGRV
jgi:hypothetical protein